MRADHLTQMCVFVCVWMRVCASRLPWQSDLAVLQVGVDVLDEGVVGVTDGEDQLAEGAAAHVALLRLHPELRTQTQALTC